MQVYVRDRVLVALVILSLIGFSFQFQPQPFAGWNFMVLVTLPIGVTHFVLAWFYQIRAFKRQGASLAHYWWFSGLFFVSLAISLLLIFFNQLYLLIVVNFVYFMLHVLLNEFTLFQGTSVYNLCKTLYITGGKTRCKTLLITPLTTLGEKLR
jgi:hypothetical protein